MRTMLAGIAALTLAACQTPCPSPDTTPVTRSFRCEDGSVLTATFVRSPDVVRIAQEGYVAIELPARVTGAGYRYTGEGADLRGRGSVAQWTRPGAAETECRETAAR